MACCSLLKIFTDNDITPVLEGSINLCYLPNIRSYVVRGNPLGGNKSVECIDYCPFCGASLPGRLDFKLTEILKSEYGLTSWRDFEKAPSEFQTDEWWKKRGL